MKNKYGLLFKTGDSEIRALRNFSNKKGIFPIIELTRGRKTKKDTIGDIQKRIDQLAECFGNMDIILDLTTEPALSSTQIDMFYIPDNGYKNWINFLIEIKEKDIFKDIYPSILLNVDDDYFEDNLEKQVSSILKKFSGISYRCNIEDEGYSDDIDIISKSISSDKKFFFIIDCSYIRASELSSCKEQAVRIIEDVYNKIPHVNFILASTSFPDKIGEDDSSTLHLANIRNIHQKKVGIYVFNPDGTISEKRRALEQKVFSKEDALNTIPALFLKKYFSLPSTLTADQVRGKLMNCKREIVKNSLHSYMKSIISYKYENFIENKGEVVHFEDVSILSLRNYSVLK